jgi:hypothetical protein
MTWRLVSAIVVVIVPVQGRFFLFTDEKTLFIPKNLRLSRA